jgi:hypothetical protein
MKFLKAVFGKTRRDRITNIHSRGEHKLEEIQNHIEKSGLRLFGHVKRMDEHIIPKAYWK